MKKKRPPPHAAPPAAPSSGEELVDAARGVIIEADRLLAGRKPKPPTERFRAAVEKLRALVPDRVPGLVLDADVSRVPEEHAKVSSARTPEEWDQRVLEWALQQDGPITLDRAFTALAPNTPIDSPEHVAIAASLKRLPRSQFTVSWYMANTALAPVWTRQAKHAK